MVAHRTSPTNLGLYLLSAIAAHDFGWLGTHETVERLEATLATMSRLERFRGHFYNWYDTRDLRPLEPKYVSSVDSGNLAGHLIALGNACREIAGRPIAGSRWRSGIEDAVAAHARVTARARRRSPYPHGYREAAGRGARRAAGPRSPRIRGLRRRWPNSWRNSAVHAGSVVDIARTLTAERGDGAGGAELLAWAEAIARLRSIAISARPNC